MALNRRLFRTLGLGWLGFLSLGFTIHFFLKSTPITLIVDRSYCAPPNWSLVSQEYDQIYQKVQRQEIILESMVLVSGLGEEHLNGPLTPQAFQALKTYGQPDQARLQSLLASATNPRLLSCQGPPP